MKVIKNKKYAVFSIATLTLGTLLYIFPPQLDTTSADSCSTSGGNKTCTNTSGSTHDASGEWEWQVNVQETLNMTVTADTASQSHATGAVDTL